MGHLPEREVCYMRRHIDFDKIGITDDVMFCTVLSNSEDCREFLQRILGIEIEEIVVVGMSVHLLHQCPCNESPSPVGHGNVRRDLVSFEHRIHCGNASL